MKREDQKKMENNLGEKESITLSEVRLVLIGGRWAGKSSSGNTILRKERFECGRTRTAQSEVRHEVVEGKQLTVVDAPGWRRYFSLTEIPEGDKQRFKLSATKCPPGPNVFLLIIPIDSAFSAEQRRIVEEHMKLLGDRVWKYTMVLFTCGDFLGEKTIEQHIESEGKALKWLVERCRNRYHVLNNKEKSNSSQVTLLLKKIDEMVWNNNGSCYQVDEQTLNIIKKKQREVAERAEIRWRRAEEQRQQMQTLIPEEMKSIAKLQMILLGSRNVGKTSVGNTILGIKEQEDGKRTAHSVARRGFVGETEITLVDTPGWWKGFSVFDTTEVIKEEVLRSMFLCPPGPHVFLLVIDADASFNAKHFNAVTTHMELLGEAVWRHTIIVFTRGDWLGKHTIEEYIEEEGEALQSLVEQCGNRYHVIDNKNADDGTQITELLQKITGTVAGNGWDHFAPDEKILLAIEEKRQRVEEGARLRQSQVTAKRKEKNSRNELKELRIVMLGQKTVGKSATGNNLLRTEVFPTCKNEHCQVEEGEVDGRSITVIDTPGWWTESSRCTEEMDKEIVRGLSMSQLKHVLKQRLEEEYRRRELELMKGFKGILLELQTEIRGSVTSTKSKSLIGDMTKIKAKGIGQRKKDGKEKEENIDARINQEIEKLDRDIMRSTDLLRSSKDILIPDFKGDSPAPSIAESLTDRRGSTSHFDKVLRWLSTLQISTNVENQLTLDFSQTSGYRSVLPHEDLDLD